MLCYRPAMPDQCFRSRQLDGVKLIEQFLFVSHRDEGEIRRRAVGINVSESASHPRAIAGDFADDSMNFVLDVGVEIGEALPGDRGFESVREHASRGQVLSQVTGSEERVAPGAGRALAMRT